MPLQCAEPEYEIEDFGETFVCSDCNAALHYDYLDEDATEEAGHRVCVFCSGR